VQASYIITFRADVEGYRRRNLETTLAWLSTLRSRNELQVIVIEQSRTPTINAADDELFQQVELLHAFSDRPFNKSWGLNIGARLAKTQCLFFADADMIIPTDIEETLELMARGVEVVKPYTKMIDLNAAQTEALDDGVLPEEALAGEQATDRAHKGEHLVLAGGIFATQSQRFARLGGFDERFVGWGGEDDAMTLKIQRVQASTMLLEGLALHLYHPRDQTALMNHAHYGPNTALLEQYRQLPETALLRMFEIQKQMIGNPRKYSPQSLAALAQ
jgi:predicted glycosyltransferase involved in capsule biosynthesis